MTGRQFKQWAIGAGIVAGVIVIAKGYQAAKQAATRVVNGVNPTRTDNFVYSGVNAVGEVLTGDKDFSLGGWIYDKLHPSEGLLETDGQDSNIIDRNMNEGIAE